MNNIYVYHKDSGIIVGRNRKRWAKDAFVSFCSDTGKGFHTRKGMTVFNTPYSDSHQKIHLPSIRKFSYTGVCLVIPKIEKDNCTISMFYPLQLDNLVSDDEVKECVKELEYVYHTDIVEALTYKDKKYLSVKVGNHGCNYDLYYICVYYYHKKRVLLLVPCIMFNKEIPPINGKLLYSSLGEKLSGTNLDKMNRFEICNYLLDECFTEDFLCTNTGNTMFLESNDINNYDKYFDMSLIRNMILRGYVTTIPISDSLFILDVNINRLNSLFNKYSLDDILSIREFNIYTKKLKV